MTNPPPSSPTRFDQLPWRWLALVLVVIILLAVFPPFHVIRLGVDRKTVAAADVAGSFDAVAFTAAFWTEKLQPAATRAPALALIALAVRADPMAAAKQYGHKVGEGTTWYYFARGSGRVIAVEKSRLLLEVDDAPGAIVAVRTGPVFGNAARDSSGLIELNSVPGLAEFNAVSAELNRRVEHSVQPRLKTGVEVGARISFAGCAEAPENIGGPAEPILTLIPVQAEVR